jgi:hypothetical protein
MLIVPGSFPFASNRVSQCGAYADVAREMETSVFIVSFLKDGFPHNGLAMCLLLLYICYHAFVYKIAIFENHSEVIAFNLFEYL